MFVILLWQWRPFTCSQWHLFFLIMRRDLQMLQWFSQFYNFRWIVRLDRPNMNTYVCLHLAFIATRLHGLLTFILIFSFVPVQYLYKSVIYITFKEKRILRRIFRVRNITLWMLRKQLAHAWHQFRILSVIYSEWIWEFFIICANTFDAKAREKFVWMICVYESMMR